ncbi:MAG: hypothetical protein ACK5KT_11755 [Dysgonomonas sp.]
MIHRNKYISYYLTITILLISITVVSCKSASMNQSDASVDKCKCNTSDTDSSVICFSATGESRDEMISKEKALSDAQEGLASLVQIRVLAASNKFKEWETSETEITSDVREKAVRLAVNQVLSGLRIGCENVIKTPEGTYKTYIRLEVKEQNIQKAFDKKELFIGI